MSLYTSPIEAAFGGGIDLGSISSTVQIPVYRAAITALPTDANGKIKLPDATKLGTGLNKVAVFNASSAQSLPILDYDGTELVDLPLNNLVKFHLRNNSTSAGAWSIWGQTVSGAPNVDWFLQISDRFWQMEGDFTMRIGLDRFADLTPKSTPPTGKLHIDGKEVPLVQS